MGWIIGSMVLVTIAEEYGFGNVIGIIALVIVGRMIVDKLFGKGTSASAQSTPENAAAQAEQPTVTLDDFTMDMLCGDEENARDLPETSCKD